MRSRKDRITGLARNVPHHPGTSCLASKLQYIPLGWGNCGHVRAAGEHQMNRLMLPNALREDVGNGDALGLAWLGLAWLGLAWLGLALASGTGLRSRTFVAADGAIVAVQDGNTRREATLIHPVAHRSVSTVFFASRVDNSRL